MKFIKVLLVLITCGSLVACMQPVENLHFTIIPDELKDCKMIRLTENDIGSIVVVRCPNSNTSTSYKSGKASRNSIVIDNAEK